MLNEKEKTLLSWEGAESQKDSYAQLWIVLSFIACGVIIAYSVYRKEWLMGSAFVIAVLAILWTILSKTQPLKVMITTNGIWIGKTFYDFEKIRGYWFSRRKNLVFLEQKSKVGLTAYFPLGSLDFEKIKNSLPEYLVEMKDREEDWVDRLSKKLHF